MVGIRYFSDKHLKQFWDCVHEMTHESAVFVSKVGDGNKDAGEAQEVRRESRQYFQIGQRHVVELGATK